MMAGVSTDVERRMCRARNQGWGLIEEVARRWDGRETSAQQRSTTEGVQTVVSDAPR
jgi:hypothetical protein